MARRAFAHDATVAIHPGGDSRAPGGAIANALCGGWDHPPPCPLAPHYVTCSRAGDAVTLRIVFAAEPADEQRVRTLIDRALADGQVTAPDGSVATWELRSTTTATLRADEEELAERLIAH